MISFNQLVKKSKSPDPSAPVIKLSLLGDSSTQLLKVALEGYAVSVGYSLNIYEADYNQIDLQIFDDSFDFHSAEADFVLISETYQKLQKKFYSTPIAERSSFAESEAERIKNLFGKAIESRSPKAVIFCNFQEEDEGLFGNYGNKTPASFLFQVRKLNYLMMNLAAEQPSFHILDYKLIHQRIGDDQAHSPQSLVNNDMTLSLDVLPLLSKYCMDIILAQLGIFKKCLILDLDNTTWGGVIGDDGIENIQIGSLGIGKAFTNLQLWAKELKQRGIILAICSKNYEDVAKKVFEEHPDMKLRLEDISVFVANWENKADNIRHIQSILNIGFDSMVFLDDNKFERELVKQNIPEITVPELPEDPAEYLQYVKSLNLFETASFVENDTKRTLQYQEESKRKKDEIASGSKDEFLKSLGMKALIQPFTSFNLPRVAQLIQRSNQFNLRTIRYSEAELKDLAEHKDYTCFSVSLKDKYGDYGLVSVLIVEKRKTELFIENWVMSCRVLKRGLEHFIANYIVDLAKQQGVGRVVGERIPTKKNVLVEHLYSDLGFEGEDNHWEAQVTDFKGLSCFIEKIED